MVAGAPIFVLIGLLFWGGVAAFIGALVTISKRLGNAGWPMLVAWAPVLLIPNSASLPGYLPTLIWVCWVPGVSYLWYIALKK